VLCEKTIAPEHPDLKVVTFLGTPNKLRTLDHFSYLSNEVFYGVYHNSLSTLERALLERVFFIKEDGVYKKPPDIAIGTFNGLSVFTDQLVGKSHQAIPLSPQGFVDLFQDRRVKIYQQAVNENNSYGFSPKLANVRPFVKREKYNFTAKPNAVPRVIQPRSPRYTVETGRFIKPIEKKIYKNINDVFGHTVVFKCLNARTRGLALRHHWDQFVDPVAVGLDASRFDEHVTLDALIWEHSVYESFYKGNKYFKKLIALQRSNKGVGYTKEGKILYKINRNRMSGDSNTALGNVLIMTGLIYTYASERGVNIRLADDGDDSVTIMERSDLKVFMTGLSEWFLNYGFTMTIETPVDIFEKIVFCQCQPVFDGKEYIMVRDPRTAISKDCLSLKPLVNRKVLEGWCSAVGKGGMSLTGGIPLWQEFYTIFVRESRGRKSISDPTLETGAARMARGMTRGYTQTIDPLCRFSFYLAFDVHPYEQLVIEETFRSYGLGDVKGQPPYRSLPLGM